MKFAAVVLLCLAVICAAHRHGHMRGGHEIDAASLSRFEQFMTKYEKSYETHEFHYRFNVFQDNLKKIEALNFLHQGKTTFEANEFADLTDDEFAAIYLRPVDEDVLVAFANEHREAAEPATENIPSNWDWRDQGAVSPVKNQGQCGSCWTFSTTGVVESAWYLAGHPMTLLSEQNLVDCSQNCVLRANVTECNQGCNGGTSWAAYGYVMQNGLNSEAAYPYTAQDGACKYNPNNIAARISNWAVIPSDTASIANTLYSRGPVSVSLNANDLKFYKGGIFDPYVCSDQVNHAVLAVGYGVEGTSQYYIVKNSWGTTWGEAGYFKIKIGICGIEKFPTIPIV